MPPNQICRLCLGKFLSLQSIFMNRGAQMLETLASIAVCETDSLTGVCLKCMFNLKWAYKIQQSFIAADKRLKTISSTSIESSVKNKKMNFATGTAYCLICGEFFGNTDSNDHMQGHFQVNNFCHTCNVGSRNFTDFKKHLIDSHKESPFYKCKMCYRPFFYESLYSVHLKKCNQKATESFNSLHSLNTENTIAENKTKSEMDIMEPEGKSEKFLAPNSKVHKVIKSKKPHGRIRKAISISNAKVVALMKPADKKSIQSEDPVPMAKCPCCQKVMTKRNLNKHIDNQHRGVPHTCELCGAQFKNYEGLRIHTYYLHNKARFKCDKCGKMFTQRHARDFHVKKVHDDNPDVVCEACGKKFYSSTRLKVHIEGTHQKIRPYECEFCKRAYSSRYALATHRRQHTLEAPFKCEFCSESFRQKVSLRAHKKSKHNIVEEIVCTCKKCGKGFSSEMGLDTHLRIICC